MASASTTQATFHFYGSEHPALNGTPFDINPDGVPVEVSPELAEYLATLPGIDVIFDAPVPKPTKKKE